MKIAIFSDAFYPVVSGVVTYVETITKELSYKGHQIYLFIPKSEDKRLKELIYKKNIKIFQYSGIDVPKNPGFKFTSILSFKDIKIFKEINPDIVFYQTPMTLGLKAILLSKIFNKPFVGVFHTRIAEKDTLSNIIKLNKKINLEKAAWALVKYFYKDCDAIISPSEDIKKELKQHKINKNIIVINNFIDTSKLDNKTSKINIKQNSFVYFGRISYEKNLFCLIESFKLALTKNKSLNLYFIGDGPILNDLKNFVKTNNLNKNVYFLGKIDREILLKTDLLTKFIAIVTMSNSEVQPLTLIEAMFKGLPILGPNSEGIKELVKSNGILVKRNSTKEMANAMLKISADKKLQKNLSLNSLKISKNYESSFLISKLEKESLRIIHNHKKRKSN
jgi:1,2-diacylglycerol 3-alpha-glucosyltransferase